MRAGHLIYKVENLEKGVEAWRKKGFVVEYGTQKNPYNAIIYFSEGPYIELLASTGMPTFFKKLLSLFGFKGVVDRFDSWDFGKERWCGLCIEKDAGDLEKEIEQLGEYKKKGFYLKKGKRVDVQGRKLQYKCFFPAEISLPFLMSYFNIDPKPKNFVHPNGYRKISKIKYATTKKAAKVLEGLLKDASVEVDVTGESGIIKEVEFEQA